VDVARFTPPRPSDREAAVVMVAAVGLFASFALHHRRAAELAAPDDERFVQKAALFQIFDERGTGASCLRRSA